MIKTIRSIEKSRKTFDKMAEGHSLPMKIVIYILSVLTVLVGLLIGLSLTFMFTSIIWLAFTFLFGPFVGVEFTRETSLKFFAVWLVVNGSISTVRDLMNNDDAR